ncbi:Glycosyltransferase [Halomicronema hongdechloris C2206]|uniref:Glycosyltransferase n=1 Tax=Halomicronema hongdechloris C2206 TaxID=1641165 RepID=A0A1Z3HKH2_9CYAN|nr:glycosyltransferase family 4 protein [Halomicronema hongdechloris]ASC70809.1 Glycosyltransferase [Halomicronema hongdechloris C2206]
MKIWLVNHYATPPDSGSSTRHYALARELAKYGHEVLVIVANKHHLLHHPENISRSRSKRSISIEKDSHVDFLFLPTLNYHGNGVSRLLNMISFAWQTLKLPQYVDDIPDIIIGSSVHPFAVWAAERIAKRYKIPFCFEVRDLWSQTLIDMAVISSYHPLALFLRWLESYLYRRADKIITLLPYAHECICRFNVQREKIFYLPNAVDLNFFLSAPLVYDSQKTFTVMYLGSHGPANDLKTLIEAAAELEKCYPLCPIRWRLIGEGPQKQYLKDYARKLDIKSVTLEQSIPKSQVPQVIAEADVLIFHLLKIDVFRYGISPNKLFDYLAAQKPIVFACSARNDPVAEAGAGITVPPQDPKAMAEAVYQLAILSPEERVEMGKRGRAYVERYHSYQHLGEQLNELLEEVVEEFRTVK